MNYKNKIIKYYDSSQWLYRFYCYTPQTLGMHFGFWDKNTKDRQQAILNENQAVIDLGKIKEGQKVLDAGCGVGGTAIYIAKKTGAKVWGINLSKNQINIARIYTRKNHVSELVEFSAQDYCDTNFPDDFFDIVYGIESICHAYPKSDFLKEAKRILKPGGKLIISDGYASRIPKTDKEKMIIERFNQGFVLKELITTDVMTRTIKKSGFINTKIINKTKEVTPSVSQYAQFMQKTGWMIKTLSFIPLIYFRAVKMNAQAMQSAHEAMKIGLAAYYIHYAEKRQS